MGAAFCTDNIKVHGYLVSKLGTGPGAEWIVNTLTICNVCAILERNVTVNAHSAQAPNLR
jgi:hypothetical protein